MMTSPNIMPLSKSSYNRFPEIPVEPSVSYSGYHDIARRILQVVGMTEDGRKVVVVECYHGVTASNLLEEIGRQYPGVRMVDVSRAYKSPELIEDVSSPFITEDPVFGVMNDLSIHDYMDADRLSQITSGIEGEAGLICVYGTGAALAVPDADLLVYADMPRMEIQRRFRHGALSNLGISNPSDDFSNKYKRAFFLDWRMCDSLKRSLGSRWHFVLDTTRQESPVMVDADVYRRAMDVAVSSPFRLVPFFDPGPWGGQWLKEKFDLDRNTINYAWGFDCVPEENSLLFRFGDSRMEVPALNLVFMRSNELLGEEVASHFGAEFPIRFDFLDTMEGGNLSLQVHPLKEYIKKKFGMSYTQDESYYFMDAKPGATAYLGLRDEADVDTMLEDLEHANAGDADFNADKYVSKWSVKKHDHLLIPAGTIHCSGADSVVLEISATPYIFTFKLWDWGRLDLDGKQRPISLEHGRNVIQAERRRTYVKERLFNRFERVSVGPGWVEERTGLHEGHFIETRRHIFTDSVPHLTGGTVNVINLVEGDVVFIESPDGRFPPFELHYAETVVVPASIGAYTIRPDRLGLNGKCMTIKASIRLENLNP